jgi:hypothetical protein
MMVADIRAAVAPEFNLHTDALLKRSRCRNIARPRQIVMLLARELTSQSLSNIARRLNLQDHTTIIHGIKQATRLIGEDAKLARKVSTIRERLVSAEAKIAVGSMSSEACGSSTNTAKSPQFIHSPAMQDTLVTRLELAA